MIISGSIGAVLGIVFWIGLQYIVSDYDKKKLRRDLRSNTEDALHDLIALYDTVEPKLDALNKATFIAVMEKRVLELKRVYESESDQNGVENPNKSTQDFFTKTIELIRENLDYSETVF